MSGVVNVGVVNVAQSVREGGLGSEGSEVLGCQTKFVHYCALAATHPPTASRFPAEGQPTKICNTMLAVCCCNMCCNKFIAWQRARDTSKFSSTHLT